MTHLDRPLLIHVAAESEQRGRVVLASRTATPHAVALGAAFAVAGAFDTWVDCLLLECPDVVALTAHGFARTVSHAGRIAPLSNASVVQGQSAITNSARLAVIGAAKARASGIRVATNVVSDGLVDALAKACAIEGPWNIVALAEAVQPMDGRWLRGLLDGINGATGVVCVGACAVVRERPTRPVVVVVEDLERLSQMLRTAERLARMPGAVPSRPIVLLVTGGTGEQTADLDGHLRLLLSDIPSDPSTPLTIAGSGIAHGTPAEVAEALRQLDGSFVIARSGGIAAPANGEPISLLSILQCPLLLVR